MLYFLQEIAEIAEKVREEQIKEERRRQKEEEKAKKAERNA